ncbi:MAG: class I SAM-dependent methyltransferase [Bacteroidia bacterium]|nr:class I SAM-dependent methyltransferase [Bacteroidia bacterium]MDW8235111.1 class I SAM-dependent methyltransferase [Bacteroidia bacterium]
MRKLNLGSGEFPKEGFVNVDYYSRRPPDVVHDLDVFPYPFADDAFDLVEMDHCLEHLKDPFRVMKEVHRITRPGGIVRIRVPHFSRGFTHADHKRGFDVTFPYYFNPTFAGGYMGTHYKLRKLRLHWFAQPYLKKMVMPRAVYYLGRILGGLIDFWANLSPMIASRMWCFWVGGFEEVFFEFEVVKEPSTPSKNVESASVALAK